LLIGSTGSGIVVRERQLVDNEAAIELREVELDDISSV
jgi:hypothetical protein